MINFPKPYPDELLYSILARARVRFCEVSPKRLIDLAMGTRTAISTINLPSRLNALSETNSLTLPSSEQLTYNNTLFPLYAPFMPENRRLQCLSLLKGKSYGAVHLCSGYACSRIPKLHHIRCCPKCYSEQWNTLGEPYWMRVHQISGIDYCPIHQTKLVLAQPYHSVSKRHEYIPLSILSINHENVSTTPVLDCFYWLEKQIVALLEQAPEVSASYEQWTAFYHELICEVEMDKGYYVNYSRVKSAVLKAWPFDWLCAMNLVPSDSESCWLHCITRKHRKSFSYLEHLVLIYAIKGEPASIVQVLDWVQSIKKVVNRTYQSCPHSEKELRIYKLNWLRLVKTFGTKIARASGGGAIYAWLYRHDRDWLLKINLRYKHPIPVVNNRVNWRQRDIQLVRELTKIRDFYLLDIEGERRSQKWYLSQLDRGTSVENYFKKLPLTSEFLHRFSEDVSDYQIRRITNTLVNERNEKIARWVLLRKSGLSDERMTSLTAEFLKNLLSTCQSNSPYFGENKHRIYDDKN